MSYHEHSDTIVALSTPQGVGALAVVRLSGDKAIAIVNSIFKGKDLSKVESHTLHFGTIRNDEEVIDEVVLSVFKGPNSYTKEAEDAAALRTLIMRDLEDLEFTGLGLKGVDPVHQVVADVHLAVRVQHEVVHLRELVTDWPFCDRR